MISVNQITPIGTESEIFINPKCIVSMSFDEEYKIGYINLSNRTRLEVKEKEYVRVLTKMRTA